ncbi:hypothetical protein BHM03_00029207 [Ensete ventricosum]|nr:hypothetical protein BHM03_00029207 [Ensete ventricosum]
MDGMIRESGRHRRADRIRSRRAREPIPGIENGKREKIGTYTIHQLGIPTQSNHERSFEYARRCTPTNPDRVGSTVPWRQGKRVGGCTDGIYSSIDLNGCDDARTEGPHIRSRGRARKTSSIDLRYVNNVGNPDVAFNIRAV